MRPIESCENPETLARKKILDDVKAFRWHVMKVLEDNKGPGLAYTIGLQHSLQHPELNIVGLPADLSHLTLNIAGQAKRGERFSFANGSPCLRA